MRKIYVLDTNVPLSDYMSYRQFEDNIVVIPSVTLEEIDSKKKFMDSLGFNARAFGRELDKLRVQGSLIDGINLDNGGLFKVHLKRELELAKLNFCEITNDDLIIATALSVKEQNPEIPVVLVSKDTLMRVKADAVGLCAEDYLSDKVLSSNSELYTGYTVVDADAKTINTLQKDKKVKYDLGEKPPNHYVILQNKTQAVAGRYTNGYITPLYNYSGQHIFGVQARNIGQAIAFDLLMNSEVQLVTLVGKAGTGKTLKALAAALEQTIETGAKYDRTLVARPVVPMGKDIGYLPGDKDEKLRPWMQPIFDNLEFILNCKERKETVEKTLEGYDGKIQVEALTYIRGRSIPDQFIIIDEAQNLTKHEVKTILTRVGEGSKIVLMGDPEQIDHPYLDQYNNGLTYVVETMKNEKLVGHVTLTRGERSTLAQLCADLL